MERFSFLGIHHCSNSISALYHVYTVAIGERALPISKNITLVMIYIPLIGVNDD